VRAWLRMDKAGRDVGDTTRGSHVDTNGVANKTEVHYVTIGRLSGLPGA
jgi:hypothetical protein